MKTSFLLLSPLSTWDSSRKVTEPNRPVTGPLAYASYLKRSFRKHSGVHLKKRQEAKSQLKWGHLDDWFKSLKIDKQRGPRPIYLGNFYNINNAEFITSATSVNNIEFIMLVTYNASFSIKIFCDQGNKLLVLLTWSLKTLISSGLYIWAFLCLRFSFVCAPDDAWLLHCLSYFCLLGTDCLNFDAHFLFVCDEWPQQEYCKLGFYLLWNNVKMFNV